MKVRPFAYNPTKTPITGVKQINDFAIGLTRQEYAASPGSVTWWNGPDEELGYVIAYTVPAGNRHTPIGNIGTVGFLRSTALTEQKFVEITNIAFSQSFTTGMDAKYWLNTNGYWTSWDADIYIDPGDANCYPGSGTVVTNIGIGGTSITGTISGAAYEPSTANGIFNFDGGADKITFGNYDFGNTITINAWVYPRSEYSINTIMSNAGANLGTNGFKIEWNNWNTQDLKMIVEAGNGTSGNTYTTTNSAVTENTWQMLTYVVDFVNRTVSLYKNASVQASGGDLVADVSRNNANWWIGAIGGSSYNMNANFGEFKIFRSLLTSNQITNEYNISKARYGL